VLALQQQLSRAFYTKKKGKERLWSVTVDTANPLESPLG
jgi:hypothetical protein